MSVRSHTRLPLGEAPVGLRLYPRNPAAGSPAAERVRYLVDLRERAEHEEAVRQAAVACLEKIAAAVDPVPGQIHQRLEEIAGMATELGLAVAREVVGTALDRGHVDPTDVVHRCLLEATRGADGADLTVHLSPDDLGPVITRLEGIPELAGRLQQADFAADPALGPGCVRVESNAGRLSYDPLEVLGRVSDAVRQEVSG